MDPTAFAAAVPDLLGNIDDVESEVLAPEWFGASLPGEPPMFAGAWTFWIRTAVGTIKVYNNSRTEMRVTLGLVLDVPYTSDVAVRLNRLNYKEMVFGRLYLVGNDESGRGAILMQEIVHAAPVSWDHMPSVQHVVYVVAHLLGMADNMAPPLLQQFGGRLFTREDGMFIANHG